MVYPIVIGYCIRIVSASSLRRLGPYLVPSLGFEPRRLSAQALNLLARPSSPTRVKKTKWSASGLISGDPANPISSYHGLLTVAAGAVLHFGKNDGALHPFAGFRASPDY